MSRVYWCKIFRTKHDVLVAICDGKILGKKLEHGKVSVKVDKEFYGGIMIESDAAIKFMTEATIGNLMGAEIVGLAEKNGFITKENVILIDGVPHAQFVKI